MGQTTPPQAERTRAAAPALVEPLEGRRLLSVVVGLQTLNKLISFDSATPGDVLARVKVKGLERRENLLGIDYRPATGVLYGLASTNRLYTIDIVTGRATAVGAGPFDVRLNGTQFGVDFDPAADVLRIVSDADQNLRIDPDTGAVIDGNPAAVGDQGDADLAFERADPNAGKDPSVVAIATATTTLLGVDSAQDVLVRQGTPGGAPVSAEAGRLFTVGPLGIDVETIAGLDVVTTGSSQAVVAALSTNIRRASQLYTVNVETGAAASLGRIGRGRRVTLDVAAAPAGTEFFVVTRGNQLVGLNTATPNVVLSRNRISGLASRGERVVGIDARPATGELWVLSDSDRLYTVIPATGAATAIGTPSAVDLAPRMPLGFDFDPAADRIRVTNAAGRNLRFDPATGASVDSDPLDPDIDADGVPTYVAGGQNSWEVPRIVGSAYANNLGGDSATTLYALDSALDVLVTQGSPGGSPTPADTGLLFTVGPTTQNIPDQIGFDILTRDGVDTALAVFAPARSRAVGVHFVDLATGAITLISSLNRRVGPVVGMTIAGVSRHFARCPFRSPLPPCTRERE